MKALLGTKVGMTTIFDEAGKRYAATVVYVEPNQVLETKTLEKDGYIATKVGYQTVKEKSLNKPELGYFKKVKAEPKRFVKELRGVEGYNQGDVITVDAFEAGQFVDVQAYTKGHGFTGSIKRHNFSVGPLGHGAGYPHRYVGSISGGRGGSQAQRVFKGTELPGHYGHELVTIQNQLILDVDKQNNLMIIYGAIPGPDNSLVKIKTSIKKPDVKKEVKLFSKQTKLQKAEGEIKPQEIPESTPEPAEVEQAPANNESNESKE